MNRFLPPPFIGSYPQQGQIKLQPIDPIQKDFPIRPSTTLLHPMSQRLGFSDMVKTLVPTMNTLKP